MSTRYRAIGNSAPYMLTIPCALVMVVYSARLQGRGDYADTVGTPGSDTPSGRRH